MSKYYVIITINAVFAGIMIIYGPQFFIVWPTIVFYTRGEDNNSKIKRRYNYYNSFRRRCVFLHVLCLALFNQIVQTLITKLRILRQGKGKSDVKRYLFVLISHSYFFMFQIQCFCFYHLLIFFFSFQQTKRMRKNKSNRTRKKRRHQNCKIQRAVNTFYGPPNFIYARRKDVKCATTPSK